MLAGIHLHTNQKTCVATLNAVTNLKDISKSQAVMCAEKVAISRKQCKWPIEWVTFKVIHAFQDFWNVIPVLPWSRPLWGRLSFITCIRYVSTTPISL